MPIIIDHSPIPGLAEGMASVGAAFKEANEAKRADDAYQLALKRAEHQMAQEDEKMNMMRDEQERARRARESMAEGMEAVAGMSVPTPETQLPSFLPREFGVHANEQLRETRRQAEMKNIGRLGALIAKDSPELAEKFFDRATEEQKARMLKERAGIALAQIQRGMANGDLTESAQGLAEIIKSGDPEKMIQGLKLLDEMRKEAAREKRNAFTREGVQAQYSGRIQAEIQQGANAADPRIQAALGVLASVGMYEDEDGNLDGKRLKEDFEDALYDRARWKAEAEQWRARYERERATHIGPKMEAETKATGALEEQRRRGPAPRSGTSPLVDEARISGIIKDEIETGEIDGTPEAIAARRKELRAMAGLGGSVQAGFDAKAQFKADLPSLTPEEAARRARAMQLIPKEFEEMLKESRRQFGQDDGPSVVPAGSDKNEIKQPVSREPANRVAKMESALEDLKERMKALEGDDWEPSGRETVAALAEKAGMAGQAAAKGVGAGLRRKAAGWEKPLTAVGGAAIKAWDVAGTPGRLVRDALKSVRDVAKPSKAEVRRVLEAQMRELEEEIKKARE